MVLILLWYVKYYQNQKKTSIVSKEANANILIR